MDALLMVDIQNDFIPGGALAVKKGDEIVPLVNKIQNRFDLIVATKDWHPAGHGSFASSHPGRKVGDIIELNGLSQILWPDHCIQNSPGAEFHPHLDTTHIEKVIFKGTDPGIDSYSGFYDNGHRKATGLKHYLDEKGVTRLYVCGLATDYCVKFTVLDALAEGFETCLIEDACRGVELNDGDVARALEEMRAAGCRITDATRL